MENLFDAVTKAAARATTRRAAMRSIGAAFAGALFATMGGVSLSAKQNGHARCGDCCREFLDIVRGGGKDFGQCVAVCHQLVNEGADIPANCSSVGGSVTVGFVAALGLLFGGRMLMQSVTTAE